MDRMPDRHPRASRSRPRRSARPCRRRPDYRRRRDRSSARHPPSPPPTEHSAPGWECRSQASAPHLARATRTGCRTGAPTNWRWRESYAPRQTHARSASRFAPPTWFCVRPCPNSIPGQSGRGHTAAKPCRISGRSPSICHPEFREQRTALDWRFQQSPPPSTGRRFAVVITRAAQNARIVTDLGMMKPSGLADSICVF